MREDLRQLLDLQGVDLRIERIKQAQEDLPQEMKRLDEGMAEEREKFGQFVERADELERERREKERDLMSEMAKVKALEGRLFEIKTNKEYQAMLREIGLRKQKNSGLEDEILRMLDEIDALRKEQQERDQELKAFLARSMERRQGIEQELSVMGRELEEQLARRAEVARGIEGDLLRRYERIRARRAGAALAAANQGTCLGCHMHLPPQFYNELLKQAELHTCPNCHRILYVKEVSEASAEEP